ncbi:tRNA (adenosine(37)-N6)-threonylcarbamoyltransferase complex dimerization subunit type 1 TsaB [Marispirochaeta aestuarii]|uniref:tRNA (adenosine(37)-N6)-threonylcarbamoyltransferase complex dimerization subunit type 1 TsaB n=1 Tax=Marispirochaeta aestuarii TaxID=1963862 RepID=UPI0029C61E65|nr:tRNA (adenosine(37)-N6)-threonylcarbamoyltransferase complex dimerization subunit type 1 TsaB [Marispirochaeta aestuarii]
MKILAFDTSGPVLSVALETPRGRYALIRDIGLRHGEILASLIQQLCTDGETSIRDLDLIVCARGPGSFTGLRIGMSLAKGLSAGSGVPLVSLPVPDILVLPYSFCASPVIPVIDAKKGRFYGACYIGGTRKSEYFDLDAETIVQRYNSAEGILIAGPDVELFKSGLSETGNVTFAPYSPTAVFDMLSMGPVQLEKTGPDAPGQGPLYIRKSEAELGMEKDNGG